MDILDYDCRYPGFVYPADELLKFIAAGRIFTIQLTNREIIHHEADDPQQFKQWLLNNNIKDIK